VSCFSLEAIHVGDISPRTLTMRADFIHLYNKYGCNLKTVAQIFIQFYMLMYLTWFYKTNKHGYGIFDLNLWPWHLSY